MQSICSVCILLCLLIVPFYRKTTIILKSPNKQMHKNIHRYKGTNKKGEKKKKKLVPKWHTNASQRTYYCTSSSRPTYLSPLYQLHFLEVMRNKGSNDLSPHAKPKDSPPKPLLQQQRHIKRERKRSTVHPHTIYPAPSSHYPPQKKNDPSIPFLPNGFPKPDSIPNSNFTGPPPTLFLSIFATNHSCPKGTSLNGIPPTPFPQKCLI